MVNAARGEVTLDLGGRNYCLCLTLGALAEIETALGARSLSDLDEKLKDLSAGALVEIVHALLKGGGEAISMEELRGLPLNMTVLSDGVGKAFAAAGSPLADQP